MSLDTTVGLFQPHIWGSPGAPSVQNRATTVELRPTPGATIFVTTTVALTSIIRRATSAVTSRAFPRFGSRRTGGWLSVSTPSTVTREPRAVPALPTQASGARYGIDNRLVCLTR